MPDIKCSEILSELADLMYIDDEKGCIKIHDVDGDSRTYSLITVIPNKYLGTVLIDIIAYPKQYLKLRQLADKVRTLELLGLMDETK